MPRHVCTCCALQVIVRLRPIPKSRRPGRMGETRDRLLGRERHRLRDGSREERNDRSHLVLREHHVTEAKRLADDVVGVCVFATLVRAALPSPLAPCTYSSTSKPCRPRMPVSPGCHPCCLSSTSSSARREPPSKNQPQHEVLYHFTRRLCTDALTTDTTLSSHVMRLGPAVWPVYLPQRLISLLQHI